MAGRRSGYSSPLDNRNISSEGRGPRYNLVSPSEDATRPTPQQPKRKKRRNPYRPMEDMTVGR